MLYCKIIAETNVIVTNHKNLIAAWNLYKHTGLVNTFHCKAPLTEAQLRRVPAELRNRLTIG